MKSPMKSSLRSPLKSSDPDIQGSWPALLRAAKAARKLARVTGSPFYVLKNGRIADVNRSPRRRAKKK